MPPKTEAQRERCANMFCRPFIIGTFRNGDLVAVVVHRAKDRKCMGREDLQPVDDWLGV